MRSFQDVYKDKKVFITGHTGFKGAWLALWLHELGAHVAGYALKPPTTPALFNVLKLKNKIEHITGDVRDARALATAVRRCRPDVVFHLAAQPMVRRSYHEPRMTYETNVMGTVNLFEAVRNCGRVKAVVAVTSDKCYEDQALGRGFRETDPMGGHDPYSSSKGCAELVVEAYRRSFFDPNAYGRVHQVIVASVRAGNVIGGGDWGEDRLIPDCVRALGKGRQIVLRNPGHVRNWQFVLEPLSGYLWLGALMLKGGISYGQGWNFGSCEKTPVTVEQLIRKLILVWGAGKYRCAASQGSMEMKKLMLDVSKARRGLKWRTVYAVDETIDRTVRWYRDQAQGCAMSMYQRSVADIEAYVMCARGEKLPWAV